MNVENLDQFHNHHVTVDRIRKARKLATTLCQLCLKTNKRCWVKTRSRKCAECAEVKKTINECDVNATIFIKSTTNLAIVHFDWFCDWWNQLMQNQHRHHFLQLSTKDSSHSRIWWARRWMKYAESLNIAMLYRMSIHHFLHFSTLNDNERLSFVLFFLWFFSLNELLISLIDLILMILSHQSLNNFDVAIILLRIKATYVCNLARSFQSFFHFSVRSLSVRSFFVRSFFLCSFVLVRSLFAHSFCCLVSFCLFVARFKIKSKEDNKNVRLIRIKINNIHWCHVFKTYFVWNDKTSLFFAIVYFRKFKLFFRVNSTRIAKSRRDLSVIWSNSRSFDIRARIKKLALRNNKNESMSFKTNFCLFLLREVRRFFIIRVMINVNKIFSLSKNVFASKDKKAISLKNRSISFFWMTSSFRWDVKLSWIVSTFRRVVNFLATCLFFFFSFAIIATTTTSFINFLSYLFN